MRLRAKPKLVSWSRASGLIFSLLLSSVFVAGCWDEVNLQDVSYISALGVDYEDGQVVIYAQMINFASVAKTESPSAGPAETWIGEGKGKSTLLAFYDLKRAGYSTLNLEQLKTVLIHERALGQLDDVLDALNRQRASRYTSYIYGTTADIMEVMNTENFFNQSPLYSVLYMPNPHDEQYTFIEPLQMQLLVQTMKEPNELTMLPVINGKASHWRKGKKPISTQLITGTFMFQDSEYKGYFGDKTVIGLRWLNPEFHNVFVEAKTGDRTGTVSIRSSKFAISVEKNGENPTFTLNVSLIGSLVELDDELTASQIESSVQELVRGELQSLFDIGVKRGVDLLELEHHLYRYHFRYWKERLKEQDWVPDRGTLKEIKVNVLLKDPGKFDLKKGG
jgi:Ger(x)C family germination protein